MVNTIFPLLVVYILVGTQARMSAQGDSNVTEALYQTAVAKEGVSYSEIEKEIKSAQLSDKYMEAILLVHAGARSGDKQIISNATSTALRIASDASADWQRAYAKFLLPLLLKLDAREDEAAEAAKSFVDMKESQILLKASNPFLGFLTRYHKGSSDYYDDVMNELLAYYYINAQPKKVDFEKAALFGRRIQSTTNRTEFLQQLEVRKRLNSPDADKATPLQIYSPIVVPSTAVSKHHWWLWGGLLAATTFLFAIWIRASRR